MEFENWNHPSGEKYLLSEPTYPVDRADTGLRVYSDFKGPQKFLNFIKSEK